MTSRERTRLCLPAAGHVDLWLMPWIPADDVSSPYRMLDRYEAGARPLRIRRLPSGKPVLEVSDLSVSLSHSGDLALLALGRVEGLGVDLEKIRPIERIERLAERFLSPDEACAILGSPPEARPAAFFRTWVRKEAYLKGLGAGVPSSLRSFSVTVDASSPRVVSTDLESGASAWSLIDLPLPKGHVGALAVRGASPVIRFRD